MGMSSLEPFLFLASDWPSVERVHWNVTRRATELLFLVFGSLAKRERGDRSIAAGVGCDGPRGGRSGATLVCPCRDVSALPAAVNGSASFQWVSLKRRGKENTKEDAPFSGIARQDYFNANA